MNPNNKRPFSLTVAAGLLLLAGLSACKKMDSYNEIISTDKTQPAPVTNVQVHNFKGGAYITYDLPKSSNLLYVQANYRINGHDSLQTKSSYYSDTITVNGFEKSQDYTVTLYSVSRAEVYSAPQTVTVHPDTPYYRSVRPTLQITPDFGGVSISALNPDKKSIGLILIAMDSSTHQLEIQDQHYANQDTINYSVRGYDTTSQVFGVYVTDQWGNISDTLLVTIQPLYETLLDKSQFFNYNLPSDSEIGYGWALPYLWDGKTDNSSAGWHTNPGGSIPMLCTFGLGVEAKLSRFILWERPEEFAFSHGNPKVFTIWGSDNPQPQDATLPAYSDEGTVIGDWTNMGNYRYPDPPSGLPPGTPNDIDNNFVKAGVNFNVPLTSPAVRYLRIAVAETWSGGDFAHIMEISVYGKPQ